MLNTEYQWGLKLKLNPMPLNYVSPCANLSLPIPATGKNMVMRFDAFKSTGYHVYPAHQGSHLGIPDILHKCSISKWIYYFHYILKQKRPRSAKNTNHHMFETSKPPSIYVHLTMVHMRQRFTQEMSKTKYIIKAKVYFWSLMFASSLNLVFYV